MIQAARAANQELDIDDITVALIEHARRASQSEDSRAIAARFRKQTKPEKSKGKGREDSKDWRSTCDHCDGGLHKKYKCFYLIPDIRPRDWKPADGKEHLAIEAIRKKKASDTKHTDSSDSSSSEEEAKKSAKKMKKLKSFIARKVNTSIPTYGHGKESAFYMDTASDVHTIWDRSKFTSYKPFTKKNKDTLTGIDGVSIEVLGTGTAMLPIRL